MRFSIFVVALLGCSDATKLAPDAADPADGPIADAAQPDAPVCENTIAEPMRLAVGAMLDATGIHAIDTTTGTDLVIASGPVINPLAPLQPTVTLVPRTNGFDLDLVYTNATTTAQPLGQIMLRGIRLDAAQVTRRAIRDDSSEQTIALPADTGYDYAGPSFYPSSSYSPITSFSDSRYHVGIAVQYDPLEAQHELLFEVSSTPITGDAAHRNYAVDVVHRDAAKQDRIATLAAGATRRYVVNVRAVPAAQHWLETFVAYRNAFRERFGGVRYTRDPRPVVGHGLAYSELCSPENPFGMADPRLDQQGWRPWVDRIITGAAMGYPRTMLWAPTGVYCTHPENNYPDQFMTQMNAVPMMAASKQDLLEIPASGMVLGTWWGRSTLITRPWDAATVVPLDPANPTHRAAAFAELDMATALGSTMIGLDAFGWGTSEWMAYAWLSELQAHAPGVRFITEALSSDFLHTLAPSYTVSVYNPGPHVLADFLNPGHEIWAQIRWDLYFAGDPLWWKKPLADRLPEVARVAAMGMVVQVAGNGTPLEPIYDAAESWLTTVPAHLRSPCD